MRDNRRKANELKEIGTGKTTQQESSWKQNEMGRTFAKNE